MKKTLLSQTAKKMKFICNSWTYCVAISLLSVFTDPNVTNVNSLSQINTEENHAKTKLALI